MAEHHGMTKAQREAEIAKLEKKHERVFLENSLHGDAMWWRTLNARSTIDRDLPEEQSR